MIAQLFKRIGGKAIERNIRQMVQAPKFYIRTGNPFNFYSFEEEIHKLKLVQEQQKSKHHHHQQGIKPIVKQSIEELNSLYKTGNMFNFSIDPSYGQKKHQQEFRQAMKNKGNLEAFKDLKITNVVKIVYNILDNQNKSKEEQLSSQEQSLVLEAFFYNTLLSLLCEQPEVFQKILNKQEHGPLQDEILITKNLMIHIFSMPNCIEIVQGNPQLFKFIVKTAETLQVHQEVVVPFVQSFLNQTSQDPRFYKSLYDIAMILLPVQDYISESRFNQMRLGQPENYKTLDLGNISLIIRRLLSHNKEQSQGRRSFNREDIGTLCKLFFCLVRINSGYGKVCLDLSESILSNNYEYLTEIEMTSIIYSLTKLQYDRDAEVLFERKLKREMPNLLFDYDTKIEKMLQTGYFNYARIPYIIYCLQKTSKFRPQYRKNQILYICRSLMQIVMKNFEKYQAQEIVTIIYSLKLISPSFQPEIQTLYRAYFLQLAIEQQKREQGAKQQKDDGQDNDADEVDDLVIDGQQQQQPKSNNKANKQPQTTKQPSEKSASAVNNNATTQTAGLEQKQNKDQDDDDFLNDYMNKEFLVSASDDQPISKVVKTQNQVNKDIGQPVTVKSVKQDKPTINNTNQIKNQTSIKNQGFNIKMQKKRNTIQYFQQLQGLDVLCLFIGIRNIHKQSNHNKSSQNENLNSIFVINQQLFKLFLQKLNHINDNLKIKILYEVSYNHSELLDSYLFEKHFKEWIVSIQEYLNKLNNYDFIALGFIMKKYARLFSYHIDFWIRYAEEASKRNFNGPVESQRIKLVHSNMSDFYQKCLNSSSPDQKQERNRIHKVNIAYDKLQESLDRLNMTEEDKEYHSQNDEFEYENFGQYR